MRDRIRASEEAKARVRKLGENAILAFLEEVSLGSVRNLLPFLPSVSGFRKNSEAGIKQQKITLARMLTNRIDDRDYTALYVMWRAWAWEHLGDPDNVDRLIDELEELDRQNRLNSDDTTVDAVLALFSALKALSFENKCSRESIARFFEFSPFEGNPAMNDLIHSAKSAADIERDTALLTLPQRLHDDKREIESIKTKIESLASELKVATSDLAEIKAKIADQRATLRSVKESEVQRDAKLSAVLATLEQTAQAAVRLERAFEVLREQTSSTMKHSSDTRAFVDQRVAAIETVLMQAIASAVEPLRQELANYVPGPLPSAITEVEAIAERLTALYRAGPSKADIETINERLTIIEQRPTGAQAPTHHQEAETLHPAEGHSQTRSLARPIQTLTTRSMAVAMTLDTSEKICSNISAALQYLGLKTSAADPFAEEITAAILSSQIVFFNGALGHATARICAQSLSQTNAWVISIPIGLTDAFALRSALESVSSMRKTEIAAAVLDGINRSSLDATKEALTEFSIDHSLWGRPRIILFATLLEGLASIPVEPEYLEFGPVFDLDYLDWRARPDANAAVVGGVIPSAAEAAIRKQLETATGDTEEVIRLVRRFLPKPNIRIERACAAAFRALHHLHAEVREPTHLQSLAFGWIAPLWHALGVTKEQADSELDTGKCDSDRPDPRLAAMLTSDAFTAGEPP